MNKKITQARTKLAVLPQSGRTLPAKLVRALTDEELSRAFGSLTRLFETPTYDITFPTTRDGLAHNDLVD